MVKTYKPWLEEELERLRQICNEASSWQDIRERSEHVFRNGNGSVRSWDAIRSQICHRHPEWISHMRDRKDQVRECDQDGGKPAIDGLNIPSQELEAKLQRLLRLLREKNSVTVATISEDPAINVPKESVWPLIDILRERGYNITEEKRRVVLRRSWAEIERALPPLTKRRRIEALFMQGPCFGVKTQQGDLLATCLKIAEEREVFFAVMLGGLVAGRPSKAKRDEYFLATVDDQAEYVISHYPKVSFNTFLLCGPREISFRSKGEYVESLICGERDDIRYVGDEKAVIPAGRDNVKVAIAAMEAQAYTKSYPLQGIAENFQEAAHYAFEHSEPFRSLIVGGSDSGILVPHQLPIAPNRYNDFDMVAIPTLHRLTASHAVSRRRGASPVLGCLILGANFAENGEFSGLTYAYYDLTAHFKHNNYLEDVEIDDSLSDEAKTILLFLQRKPARRGELSRSIGRAIKKNGIENEAEASGKSLAVEDAVRELVKKGYIITYNDARKAYVLEKGLRKEFRPLDLTHLFETTVRFVLTSDWHIGHEGERPDLIKKIFKIAEERAVDAVVCSGNVFEGADSYTGQHQHLLYHGADSQKDRLLEVLPKSKIPLILISSPVREHDRTYYVKAGHDIVRQFTREAVALGYRIVYLGGPHGTFAHKDVTFDVQHPKGGLPYGQTYRLQRRIEMLVSTMDDLVVGPKATFMGHLHRAAFMLYKGMAGFLVPCLKDAPDDEYITALDKFAELGTWVVEFAFDQFKNLTKVEIEYIAFDTIHKKETHINIDPLIEGWNSRKAGKNKKGA